MQFSPFLGFYFQTKYLPGNLYLKSAYNIIFPQKNGDISKNSYFNISISNINGDFTSTLATNLFGREQFSIDREGFEANTHKDEYINRLSLALEYRINSSYSIKGKAEVFEFDDEDNANRALKSLYLLNFNILF